jgi:DNA polymerase-3 subunit chi
VTNVDFYVLQSAESLARPQFACRLTDKALKLGHQIYLHVVDEAAARELDTLLWSFRAQSFIPHALQGESKQEPVIIGWSEDPGEPHDLMINLDLRVPAFVGRFARVAEIVFQNDTAIRDPLLESWKHYKHYGYPIKRNNL